MREINKKHKPTAAVTKAAQADSSRKGARVTNVAQLDAKDPLPIEYNSKIFTTRRGIRYVPFINPWDSLPTLLLEAKLLSPTTLACINSKVRYCLGKGIFFKDGKDDKDFKKWAKSVNNKNHSLNEIIKYIYDNRFTFGNSYVEIVRGQLAGKKFVKVYLRNTLDCRLSYPEDGICKNVLISEEFRKRGTWNLENKNYVEIPVFSPNSLDTSWWKDDNGMEHTILHLKNEMPGYDWYGMPSNIASLPQQILEYKHSRANMDDLENNLAVGGLLVVGGNLTPEEQQELGKNIVFQHTGDGKRGRYVILSQEGLDVNNTKLIPFERTKEGSYIEIDNHIADKLVTANSWDGFLAGIHKQNGIGSGGSAYIRSIFDIVYNTTILPEQEYILEKFISPLTEIYDEWMGTNWSGYEFGMKTVMPVTFFGDIDVNAVITVDEAREIMGKEALGGKTGKSLVKAAGAKATNNPNDNPDVQTK